ncbi:DUF1642 domain-containing protein [Globicatella sanguinis]
MITREEYELLKKYRELGYKWIARDANERLYVYRETPMKSSAIWSGTTHIPEKYFTFIKWEDEKPTRIDDLIRDYEAHQVITNENVKATVPQFVADWIEGRKRRYTLASLFTLRYMPEDVCRWIAFDNENCEKMARAWLDGYEIEKEQLYTVTLINVELVKDDEGRLFFHGDMKHNNKLTRQEIESVNPRLMELAEEVE